MNSFRKLIPVAAAALMLGLGTNAFADYGECTLYTGSIYESPQRKCTTANLAIPQNKQALIGVGSDGISISGYFQIKGAITGETYLARVYAFDGLQTQYSSLPAKGFKRWVKIEGTMLNSSGTSVMSMFLSTD
jgi:hypothetical protein